MTIEINEAQLQVIFDQAESIYPEECCGILLGRFTDSSKIVVEVIPTNNDWVDPASKATKHRRFTIPPQEIFLAQKRGKELNLDIIGFFHSHLDYPAIPSECDRSQAWEIYSYPIVSVIKGKAVSIDSWVLDSNRIFQPETIKRHQNS